MGFDFGPLNRRCRDKFGDVATFTPSEGAGTPRALTGVYESEYYSDTPGIGTQTATEAFIVVKEDITDAKARDLLTYDSVNYRISEIKFDGYGMCDLVLKRI